MGDQPDIEIKGKRKLVALLCADVYGYSRLMGFDEEDTFNRLTVYREIFFRIIREQNGRVANTAGDAVLAEFASAKDAVAGATAIQTCLAGLNAKVPADRQMLFRIGINLGDVYERQGDLFGDGVNIAARIQTLADPGGIFLSASVFEQLEHKSNIPVELVGDQKVKNIEKPVRVYRVLMTRGTPPPPAPSPAAQYDTPDGDDCSILIGILPFDNLSDDPEQSYFCDGLSEDLTTALAAIPELRIVARNTMFAFRGKSPDIRRLGRDLGATHIVEGSARKSGDRFRVNAQLIETKTGNHLWAAKYDREISDLFELQDDLVHHIVSELDVHLVRGEQTRVWRASCTSAEAYDLVIRGRSIASVLAPQAYDRALSLIEKALEIDPNFVMALFTKAWFLVFQTRFGWSNNPGESMKQARLAVEKALRLDESSPEAHGGLGLILMTEQKMEQAKKEFEKAISLGPRMADLHGAYASICFRMKEYQKALWAARRANELSFFPLALTIALEAVSLRHLGRMEEALAVTRRGLNRYPGDLGLWVASASISTTLGLKKEAELARSNILEIMPDFSADKWTYGSQLYDQQTASQVASVLHSAGLP
jgi:adenylate cyclase